MHQPLAIPNAPRYPLISASEWQLITLTGPDVTSFTDVGLTDGVTYGYRICATNDAGDSAWSAVVTVTTPAELTVPAEPKGLVATTTSTTSIRLEWIDNSDNESAFLIERSTTFGEGQGALWGPIGSTNSNVTTFDDRGLVPGTVYWYRVLATNSIGDSPWSDVARAKTSGICLLPSAPGMLSALVVGNATHLTWVDNSSNESVFMIERAFRPDGRFTQIAVTRANLPAFDDVAPPQGVMFWYRVRAGNECGESAYSNIARAEPAFTIPAAPTGLHGTPSGGAIHLSWTDNSNNESAFIIERRPGLGSKWVEIGRTTTNVTEYVDNNVFPGFFYWYRVSATNRAGTSDTSNIVVVQAPRF